MKKVILPPELSEEFSGLRFIPYGDMMVRIVYGGRAYVENPVDEIHKAISRLMEYNSPNLIVSALSFRYRGRHDEVEGTLIFIDPKIFGPKPEWDGVCGHK